MATKPCSVCSSDARSAIDLCLVNGTSVRETARQFKLSASSVQRHKTTCMKRTPPALAAPSPVPAYQTPMEAVIAQQNVRSVTQRIGQLVDRMEALAQQFEDTGDAHGVLKAAKEIREGLRLMAQLSGELGPNNQVNVQVNAITMRDAPEWPVIMRIIEKHPDIKAELNRELLEAGQ